MVKSVSIAGGTGTEKIRAFFTLKEDRRHYRLAFILFWSILMYYFVQGYVVSAGLIVDKSMHPSVPKGGYYLVNKYIYQFTSPERGDIVVFKRTPDAAMLDAKRIVGLPGETVLIRSGDVYIDGHRLEEAYAVGKTHPDACSCLRSAPSLWGITLGKGIPTSKVSWRFFTSPGLMPEAATQMRTSPGSG